MRNPTSKTKTLSDFEAFKVEVNDFCIKEFVKDGFFVSYIYMLAQ